MCVVWRGGGETGGRARRIGRPTHTPSALRRPRPLRPPPPPPPPTLHIPPAAPIIAVALLHALLWLARHWSVAVDAAIAYSRVRTPTQATHVVATTTGVHGATEIVPLAPASDEEGRETVAFETGRARFVWDGQVGGFRPLRYPDASPFSTYRAASGLQPAAAAAALAAYGPNATPVPVPAFLDLLKQQLVAPFFVFQVFCVGLWCLDEYWVYSLFTLLMLVGFESTVVGQRLRNLTDLRGLQAPKPVVAVYRGGRWARTPGEALVPGDLISVGGRGGGSGSSAAAFSTTSTPTPTDVPADCLLLAGTAVVEEAVLTGESAPQWKAPLYESGAAAAATAAADGADAAAAAAAAAAGDVVNVDLDTRLDAVRHRAHVLFGGTSVLQAAPDPGAHVRTPDGGVLAVVLRTGFESAQGRLMRTILASGGRVTAASWEAGAFICLLLIFAVAAAAHVLQVGLADPTRDRFKLYLNCVMIVTSVVPPELPMELTIAVNASLLALAKKAIFCTEPFRIPLAGAVTTACFDKTGTLTSDEMVLEGVAPPVDDGRRVAIDAPLVPPSSAPPSAALVLAACHSLAPAGGGELAGDPLEKAAFAAVGWSLADGGGRVTAPRAPSSSHRATATVLRRHHFSAALRRMSAVVAVDDGGGHPPPRRRRRQGRPRSAAPPPLLHPRRLRCRSRHLRGARGARPGPGHARPAGGDGDRGRARHAAQRGGKRSVLCRVCRPRLPPAPRVQARPGRAARCRSRRHHDHGGCAPDGVPCGARAADGRQADPCARARGSGAAPRPRRPGRGAGRLL